MVCTLGAGHYDLDDKLPFRGGEPGGWHKAGASIWNDFGRPALRTRPSEEPQEFISRGGKEMSAIPLKEHQVDQKSSFRNWVGFPASPTPAAPRWRSCRTSAGRLSAAQGLCRHHRLGHLVDVSCRLDLGPRRPPRATAPCGAPLRRPAPPPGRSRGGRWRPPPTQRQGLVIRPARAPVGRALPTELTARGRCQLEMASAAVRRVEQDMLANLDANEQDQMRRLLTTCIASLTEPPASAT